MTNGIKIRAQKATIKMAASRQSGWADQVDNLQPGPASFVCLFVCLFVVRKGLFPSFLFFPLSAWEGGSWAELMHQLPAAEIDDNLTPFPLLVQQRGSFLLFFLEQPTPERRRLVVHLSFDSNSTHAHTSQSLWLPGQHLLLAKQPGV